ncbi:CAMK family protein kinase [Tritrichomonas foetus]|uniref:CAMK family protein kinase n=1 Tax=Tritrichomonas foetus TaxID=1144522 RepID=A0A1J4JFD6_9EUKA|nr:CAMK family protein kinase [Tritrichomonas foetus]|eukprot:OHS97926.1 CAMK family protein kinase [Tritrichomonas foetus]
MKKFYSSSQNFRSSSFGFFSLNFRDNFKNKSHQSMYIRKTPLIRQLQSDDEEEESEKAHKQINQYLILKTIGEGSFGKVYLALDTITKRHFALKRFKLKELQHIESGVSQLEREISVKRRIVHSSIVRLYDVLHEETTDTVYLIEDFADCGSLDGFLDKKLEMSLVKHIFLKVLHGVSYLHTRGIVHQDIKPSNILIKSDGSVFLADFGVGHSFQSTAMVVGSPAYQAPEALIDEFDSASEPPNPAEEDVWSLGIALYQTVFGKLPFTGNNVYEIVQNITHNQLEIPEGTDECLRTLLLGMLSVDPNKRFTIQDVIDSDFFKDTEFVNHIGLNRQDADLENVCRNIEYRRATVCNSNISFARQSLTPEELLRTFKTNPQGYRTGPPPQSLANVFFGVVNKCFNINC